MDDFHIIVRLLAALYAIREKGQMDCTLVSEMVLKTTAKKRDILAARLQKEGYVEGLHIIEDVDGQSFPVILWENSIPDFTIKGLE